MKITTYEVARNSLIPEAVRFANEMAGPNAPKKCTETELHAWSACWSKWYHKRMNELDREQLRDDNGEYLPHIV